MINYSKILALFCCPICSVYDRTQFRSDVRQRYDIVSNLDFVITLFFHNCAMIQEYNELQNDGLNEYLNDNTFEETKDDDSSS